MFTKIRALSFGVLAALALATTGAFAATTFTTDLNGGNGTVTNTGPGAYDFGLTLTSNDNGVGNIFTTATAAAVAGARIITGVWQYSTTDDGFGGGSSGSSFDPFGYFIDTVYVGLVQLSTDGQTSPAFQSGTFSFVVQGGNDWGFYALSTDGILGASTGVAYGNVSAVPVPAAGFLLIGALGGLAALRRRKAMTV